MSGVMTKVAVYGFIRIVFDLLGPPDWWWSIVVLVLGGVTAVHRRALCRHAARPEAAARLQHGREHRHHLRRPRACALAFKANGMPAAAALAFTAALFHVLNHSFFKSLLFFGAGAVLTATGRARHREARRPDPSDAADGLRVSRRLRGDFGAAAAQRLRLRVAGLPGHPAQSRSAAMGPEVHGAGGRRDAGAWRRARRRPASSAPSASRFSAGRVDRPRRRRETDRFSLAAMFVLLCFACCRHPAGLRHRRARAGRQGCRRQRMPPQTRSPGCRSCRSRRAAAPITACSCSPSSPVGDAGGSRSSTALPRAPLRRGPAWDCGYPDPSPATQYTADSFAQPLRRVFARGFLARERVDMPPPGDRAAGAAEVKLRDLVWDAIYAPIAAGSRRGREAQTICSSSPSANT